MDMQGDILTGWGGGGGGSQSYVTGQNTKYVIIWVKMMSHSASNNISGYIHVYTYLSDNWPFPGQQPSRDFV